MMKVIRAETYPIYIGDDIAEEFLAHLRNPEMNGVKLIVLVDENTRHHCLPKLLNRMDKLLEAALIEVPSGEDKKDIQTCSELWINFLNLRADKQTVLIILGGGVLTDLGGFVAASYKRGIRFINVPTTLVGQVDAAIGGKVGINVRELKNQVGLFANPDAVYIFPSFLETLHVREKQSGFAEMIKYGLIMDQNLWSMIKDVEFNKINNWEELIYRSVEIKNRVVKNDPYDKRFRKRLNFGHTIGHAFESLALMNKDRSMTHGIGVSMGIICETFLSSKLKGLPWDIMEEIVTYILNSFPYYRIYPDDIPRMLEIIQHDKKNTGEGINFSLIPSLGHAIIDQWCTEHQITESLQFYRELD
jgi:3-dehydroquinate synthase